MMRTFWVKLVENMLIFVGLLFTANLFIENILMQNIEIQQLKNVFPCVGFNTMIFIES